jgi:hypothetical protein
MAVKLEEGDFRGAIRIASSDESLTPMNYYITLHLSYSRKGIHLLIPITKVHLSLS